MRTLTCLLLLLFVVACNTPQKHLQNGNDDKAYESSLKRLKSGRVKSDDVAVFEQAFYLLNEKDKANLQELLAFDSLPLYPKVHKIATAIADRQLETETILDRLNSKSFYPNIEFYEILPIREKAAKKSAQYFYEKATTNFEYARRGDKASAKEAYYDLAKIENYQFEYKDSQDRLVEMKELGTTHVLINLMYYFEEDDPILNDLFFTIFDEEDYPMQEKWTTYYLQDFEGEEIDYLANFKITDIGVSDNIFEENICRAEKDVQVGTRTVEVWSEPDSAFVEVEEPVFETVYGEVINVIQHKDASFILDFFVSANQGSPEIIEDKKIYASEEWENDFSIKNGDDRAIDASSCSTVIGFEESFPRGVDLLIDAARGIKGHVKRTFRKLDLDKG